MHRPKIPERSSSKRSFTELEAQIPKLQLKRSNLSSHINEERKKLRPSRSFDSGYWVKAVEVAHMQLERIYAVEDMKEYDFLKNGGTPEQWAKEREELELQCGILKHKIDLFEAHIERLDSGVGSITEQAAQRSYVSCFLSSSLGAKANVTAGPRDTSDQSNFRNAVMKAYHYDAGADEDGLAWDVVTGRFVNKNSLTASHLFAYRHGEDAMIAIFGEEAKDDLWSAANGLCLPVGIEEHFEAGIFAICPDFPDNATYEQRMTWHNSEPKEFRIRFLDKPARPRNPVPNKPLYYQKLDDIYTYRELDGRRLQFQGSARPKARYIYFNFLLNLLRLAWRKRETASELLRPELGMPFWGTPGAYMRKGQLEGFVKQVGHRFPEIGICPKPSTPTASTPTPTTPTPATPTPATPTPALPAPELPTPAMTTPTTPTRSTYEDILAESLNSQILDSALKKSLSPDEYADDSEDSDDESSNEQGGDASENEGW